MTDLKTGDRVRIVATGYDVAEDPNLAVGQLGTILTVLDGACLLRMDEGPRHTVDDGEGWCFDNVEVQKIEGGAA